MYSRAGARSFMEKCRIGSANNSHISGDYFTQMEVEVLGSGIHIAQQKLEKSFFTIINYR